eukprot:jgi/Mesen1/1348/ME000013S00840
MYALPRALPSSLPRCVTASSLQTSPPQSFSSGVRAGAYVSMRLPLRGLGNCCRSLQALSSARSVNQGFTETVMRKPHRGFGLRLVKPSQARALSAAAKEAPENIGTASNGPWLIVGLGNPGSKYEGTRHNVGFEMIDMVARSEGISMTTLQCKALVGKGRIAGVPVLLAKPQTYMNLSGDAVGPLGIYYKIPHDRTLVMYDDLDLDLAITRLLPKGGHGGHNGMRSIIQHFKGDKVFPRMRIGIGRPPGNMNVAAYVLQKFDKREREEIDYSLQRGVAGVQLVLSEGLGKAVSTWNVPRTSELYR